MNKVQNGKTHRTRGINKPKGAHHTKARATRSASRAPAPVLSPRGRGSNGNIETTGKRALIIVKIDGEITLHSESGTDED